MKQTDRSPDEMLREEFNRWAEAGKGEEMERHHFDITQKTLARMELRFGERVLDLGCGAGWASRILARMVGGEAGGSGRVVGLDIADEMVRRARAASDEFENLTFVHGSAESIPWEENFFDKVLSVESFYYYADQDRVLGELYRVLAPRGRLFILINLYKDNPCSLRWMDELKVPVPARSADEYVELLRAHAFEEVEAHRVPDHTPSHAEYSGRWFRDVHELNDFKRIGALLLVARKPAVRPPTDD
jgi:ubiquinone/menaquinone biosynthesis C-methylase UbiE